MTKEGPVLLNSWRTSTTGCDGAGAHGIFADGGSLGGAQTLEGGGGRPGAAVGATAGGGGKPGAGCNPGTGAGNDSAGGACAACGGIWGATVEGGACTGIGIGGIPGAGAFFATGGGKQGAADTGGAGTPGIGAG